MNYLAHIFLSGDNRRVQIGNFVGDAVKGRAYENYPSGFREGILLHGSSSRGSGGNRYVAR